MKLEQFPHGSQQFSRFRSRSPSPEILPQARLTESDVEYSGHSTAPMSPGDGRSSANVESLAADEELDDNIDRAAEDQANSSGVPVGGGMRDRDQRNTHGAA